MGIHLEGYTPRGVGNYRWSRTNELATERILKPGGLANFVLNDYREKGNLVNMHADFMTAVLKGTGLVMWDMVISVIMAQTMRFRSRDYKLRRTVKCHEYIMTFKKI